MYIVYTISISASNQLCIRSAPSDVIDQLTSLPVTVNRHHWCLTRENFTKLAFVICNDNDNDKDREHASQSWKLFHWQKSRQWQWPTSGCLTNLWCDDKDNREKHLTSHHGQVWYGCLLEHSIWELWSKWSSLSFDSRGKRLSLLCHSGMLKMLMLLFAS